MGVATINNIRHHIITDAVVSLVRPGLIGSAMVLVTLQYLLRHVTRDEGPRDGSR